MSNAIGNSTPLGSFTITKSGPITFSGAINLTGNLVQTNAATGATTFNNTVIVNSATLRGTSFAVNNSFSAAGALSVTNSGTFTKGATGTITASGGFNTTGNANLANNITTTNTALTIGGSLTVAEATALTLTCGTGTLTVTGAIDGTAGGSGETLVLSASGGSVLMSNAVGNSVPLQSLSIIAPTITQSSSVKTIGTVGYTGTTLITLGDNITTSGGAIGMTGPIAIAGTPLLDSTNSDGSAAGANISFSSTIDGAAAFTLLAGTSGNIIFGGDVGTTTPLLSLTATAHQITAAPNFHATGSSLHFIGPVLLVANTSMTDTGSGITFSDTVTGPSFNLALTASDANGQIISGGVIDLSSASGANGGSLTASAGDIITLSDVLTIGANNLGGPGFNGGAVSCTSSNNSITIGSVNSSGGTSNVASGGNSGNISLQPSAGFTTTSLGDLPNGRLFFNGNLTALGGTGSSSGTNGTISLAPIGRTHLLSVATMISSSGDPIVMNAGNITFGANEAITVFGALTLMASSEIALTDTVVTEGLHVTAPSIIWQLYEPGNQLLDSLGQLYLSISVHGFATTSLSFTGSQTFTGIGAEPHIQLLSLSSSELQSLLSYSGYVLNFDLPSSAPVPLSTSFPVILFGFLNSELFFQIQRFHDWVYRPEPYWTNEFSKRQFLVQKKNSSSRLTKKNSLDRSPILW